jgi:Putative auto-transporter adhesin, head GIN domain
MKAIETFYADEVKVSIYFKDNIDLIDANEGSTVKSDATFKQKKIELKAQEAGRIKIKINTDHVDVKSVTGGKIELEGYAKNQNVLVNTGGVYKGGDLETENTTVKASTGGNAIVHASILVDANANLGGTITVKGDPQDLKKEESLGGYIRD